MPDLLPVESLAYWQTKIGIDAEIFAQLSDQAKTMALIVQGVAQGDQLAGIWAAVQSSISNGTTFATFQSQCADIFGALGWTGKGAYRAELVYRNAMQSAYMAGQYMQLWADRDIFPYWRYVAIRDERTRPRHRAMHGKVWPAGHAIWRIWWPPNGHNCRCSVIGMTPEDMAELGLQVETVDPTGQQIPLFDEDGALKGMIELRPDTGWASNVGLGLAESAAAMAGGKIADYPAWIGSLVLESIITDSDAALLLAAAEENN